MITELSRDINRFREISNLKNKISSIHYEINYMPYWLYILKMLLKVIIICFTLFSLLVFLTLDIEYFVIISLVTVVLPLSLYTILVFFYFKNAKSKKQIHFSKEIENYTNELNNLMIIFNKECVLPELYRDETVMNKIFEYFENNRVDNIKEAINLYESEKVLDNIYYELKKHSENSSEYQKQTIEQQRKIIKQIEKSNKKLNSIKNKI